MGLQCYSLQPLSQLAAPSLVVCQITQFLEFVPILPTDDNDVSPQFYLFPCLPAACLSLCLSVCLPACLYVRGSVFHKRYCVDFLSSIYQFVCVLLLILPSSHSHFFPPSLPSTIISLSLNLSSPPFVTTSPSCPPPPNSSPVHE